MPYGYGTQACQSRMLELGSLAVVNGSPLASLRASVVAARRTLADAGWPGDPTLPLDRKALDCALLRCQSETTASGLNSKWAEIITVFSAKLYGARSAKRRRGDAVPAC